MSEESSASMFFLPQSRGLRRRSASVLFVDVAVVDSADEEADEPATTPVTPHNEIAIQAIMAARAVILKAHCELRVLR